MIEDLKIWTIKAVIVAVLYVIAADSIDRLKYNRCLSESYGAVVGSKEWNNKDFAADIGRLKYKCLM